MHIHMSSLIPSPAPLVSSGGLTITEYEGSPRRYGPRLDSSPLGGDRREYHYDEDSPPESISSGSPRRQKGSPSAKGDSSPLAKPAAFVLANNNNRRSPSQPIGPPNGSVLQSSHSPSAPSSSAVTSSGGGPGHHHPHPPPPGGLGGASQLISAGESEPLAGPPPPSSLVSPSPQVKTKGERQKMAGKGGVVMR